MTEHSGALNLDHLVTVSHPQGPQAEAYRTLYANLRFSSVDAPARLVLFTSAGQDDRKSSALANLAVSAARSGARVLLVDGDFRRPSVHAVFGLPNHKGLSSMLLDDGGEEIPSHPTGLAGLEVLTSGPLPPNPGELLGSKRLEGVLAALRSAADLVLLDAPPATAAADASILGSRVDGVVLMISASRTRRDEAVRAKDQLERVGARLLGVVLGDARIKLG